MSNFLSVWTCGASAGALRWGGPGFVPSISERHYVYPYFTDVGWWMFSCIYAPYILLPRPPRRLKILVNNVITKNLTRRILRDASPNNSVMVFFRHANLYDGDFDYLRYFEGFLSRFGRELATWNSSDLTEPGYLMSMLPSLRWFITKPHC